jgi:hypothetical protein
MNINSIYLYSFIDYILFNILMNNIDNTEPQYFIYTNGFWDGFDNKTDANHIGFFELLFSKTKLKNFQITKDLKKANVLFESLFGSTLVNVKKWKYKIHYSGESYAYNNSNYDIILKSEITKNNIVDLPLFVYYMYNNNLIDNLIFRNITQIPTKFCCFIVSNPKCQIRNFVFQELNKYKRVDSFGKFANNVGYVLQHNYWSKEYIDFIKQYKFIICFENSKTETYITEKIINPLIAGIIPVYWGTHHIKNIFNTNSLLFLENENQQEINNLIEKIKQLDNDDAKYIEFVNQPVFTNNTINYWNNHYTIDKIANSIDKLL